MQSVGDPRVDCNFFENNDGNPAVVVSNSGRGLFVNNNFAPDGGVLVLCGTPAASPGNGRADHPSSAREVGLSMAGAVRGAHGVIRSAKMGLRTG